VKVSLLIPTYQDIEALELILEALEYQTYKDFEVIVAEDEASNAYKSLLKKFNRLEIKHVFHEDKGNRKATILNKALAEVSGKYLIFIDGDTIPFSTFIASHVALSEPKTVLCGRRVNMGVTVSEDIRAKKRSVHEIEKHYFKNYNYLKKNGTRHYEQGLCFKPNSWIQKQLSNSNKNIHILGSNFSCFREDFFKINGFDEDIIGGSKDDVDLEWRLIDSGCRLKSVKYCANLFHLHHDRVSRVDEEKIAKEQMQKNRDARRYICMNGIKKL
jgi:cellulose synthase/poly-beta-1,6-N-acetylglucosamine synthase-like glycosyltransferase